MENPLSPSQVIQAILDVYGDSRFAFEPNGGNLGDILISAGCICALDKSGASWSMLNGRPLDSDSFDVLIYGGGGNLVPNYYGAAAFLEKAIACGKPIVILPHTIRSHSDTLKALKYGIIFCRDLLSLHYVRSNLDVCSYYAVDMATGIDMNMFGYHSIFPLRHSIRSSIPPVKHSLTALRMDSESSIPTELLPPNNVDISVAVPAVGSIKTSIITQASLFLASLALFDEVITDRLHVAIGTLHVGGSVHAIENNYGKLRAVLMPILELGLFPNESINLYADYQAYKASS